MAAKPSPSSDFLLLGASNKVYWWVQYLQDIQDGVKFIWSHRCSILIRHPFDCCNRGYVVLGLSNSSLWRSLPFTDNNRLTLVVVVIVGLLAVAAIVISAVSTPRNGGPDINIQQGVPSGGSGGAQTPIVVNTAGSATKGRSPSRGTIFLLATGHTFGAHTYL